MSRSLSPTRATSSSPLVSEAKAFLAKELPLPTPQRRLFVIDSELRYVFQHLGTIDRSSHRRSSARLRRLSRTLSRSHTLERASHTRLESAPTHSSRRILDLDAGKCRPPSRARAGRATPRTGRARATRRSGEYVHVSTRISANSSPI